MARLVAQEGQNKGMSFEIRGLSFSIGRDLSNDIQILYEKVSRIHAKIVFLEGEYHLKDKGSKNKTFLNGKPVDSAVLENNDVISIGNASFVFVKEVEDISKLKEKIFSDEKASRETVVNTVPLWNVDLLKKFLISNSTLELQNTKRYLVDLYELAREFPRFEDERSLLRNTALKIAEVISSDRIFPALRNSDLKDGWEIVDPGDADSVMSLAKTPVSKTAFERAYQERAAVIIRKDAEEEVSESMVKYDIHSALCVPLTASGDKDTIIGMVYADRLGGGEDFTKLELEFVSAAAILISDALSNLESIKKLRRKGDILTKEIRSKYNIVGESRGTKGILEFIEKAGKSASGVVLIMGESGTGKELVARAIHYVSRRSDELFQAISCAAIAETLLESELFGHVKGAFTGAEADKMGIFERADGGTLFLDEIGEMSKTGQAKLLRVLEQGEVCRVGGTKVFNVDVRVIAATNKDLEKEIGEGNFREDLYHRLDVLTVNIPPLRARKEDVKILLDYFSEHFSKECGRTVCFTEKAVEVLSAYPWPGNIRELRNFVERTFILFLKDTVDADDLPAKMLYGSGRSLDDVSLDAVIKAHVLKVLDIADGNKKKAAEMLSIDRSTLYAKLESFKKDDT